MAYGDRKQSRVELSYRCGRCKSDQTYLPGEQPPIPCRVCEWPHGTRDVDDVPNQIKLNLSDYGG